MIRNDAEILELVPETLSQRPTVRIRGEVDLGNAPRLLHDLLSVSYHAPRGIVLDLTDTTFLDCRGAGALLIVRQVQQFLGRSFELRGARGCVRKVLACSGLTDAECGARAPPHPGDAPHHVQATAASVLHGDEDRWDLVKRVVKTELQEFLPHREG